MAVTLTARPRTERGKNAARQLRRAGLVPGVVYGHGDETQAIALSALELERLLSSISVENTLVELRVEGGAPLQALIREVQHHPSRPGIVHVDFFHVHAGERLRVEVPVRLHGTPVGVRDFGGVLQEVLRDLAVECLPTEIPEGVDIDVENLGVGESVHVRDVSLPNVKILNDPDLTICTVAAPTVAPVPSDEVEGEVSETEPEVIRRRADQPQAPVT